MVAWEVLLEIYPGSYNKLNSYNSTKDNLSNTQAHLREPSIDSSPGGQIRWAGEEGRRKCRDVSLGSRSSLQSQEREEFRLHAHSLCSQSCLRDEHITQLNPVFGAVTSEQRPNTEGWELWFKPSQPYIKQKKEDMKPGRLALPLSQSSPQC